MASTNDHNSKTDRNTIAETGPHEAGEFKPRLIVVSGMMLGLQIELGNEPVTIGRASECALSLQHPSVSRHHCEISRDGDRYFIEDLGSTNRTYLNGKPVRREELHDGDQISVGNNAIKFFTGHSLEAKYHDELIDLAIYDSLTGFYNRRHFHTLLDEEIERAKGTHAGQRADDGPRSLQEHQRPLRPSRRRSGADQRRADHARATRRPMRRSAVSAARNSRSRWPAGRSTKRSRSRKNCAMRSQPSRSKRAIRNCRSRSASASRRPAASSRPPRNCSTAPTTGFIAPSRPDATASASKD